MNNNNLNPFASLQYSDPILQQYYLTVQQSLLPKSLEGDTTSRTSTTSTNITNSSSASSAPVPGAKKNRVVKMASSYSSSSFAVPGTNSSTSGIAINVTPIPSSASSVTSYSGTTSGSTSGSGSESDVPSLAAAAAANARTQAAAMAVAAQVGAPVSAAAAMFGGNPQALAAMAMAQAGGDMKMFSPQAQQVAAAGYSAQNMVATPHHPIPEFLYQLTKMLTDDNTTYIEWKEGRIFVYDPPGLADNVLQRYFRHSKYASFQRQLNYFGFRKIAGKGKMSPCSYINENATDDIRSLLFIKRKTNGPKAAHAKKIGSLGADSGASSSGGGRKRKAAASNKSQTRVIPPSQPAPTNFVAQGGNQPYGAVLAHQQALLTAQQQQQVSTGAPANYVGVGAGAGAGAPPNVATSMSTSETFHFPTDQAMQQLQIQQQQLQLLQQQEQIQQQQLQQQLQQQRQQLESLQAQTNQQTQQQQATTAAGTASASMPCPATMAMNAASAANALAGGNGGGPTIGGGNSLFESSANLASLLKTDTTTVDAGNGAAVGGAQGPSQMGVGGGVASLSAATSSAFLSSLPSSNTLFPDSMSSLSLNRLFTGATPAPGGMGGGVPSMLGLSGYFSRENSLYNLAMGLPANQSSQALQAMGMSAPTASEPSALPDGNDAAAKIMG